jgi:hypothetical protein
VAQSTANSLFFWKTKNSIFDSIPFLFFFFTDFFISIVWETIKTSHKNSIWINFCFLSSAFFGIIIESYLSRIFSDWLLIQWTLNDQKPSKTFDVSENCCYFRRIFYDSEQEVLGSYWSSKWTCSWVQLPLSPKIFSKPKLNSNSVKSDYSHVYGK